MKKSFPTFRLLSESEHLAQLTFAGNKGPWTQNTINANLCMYFQPWHTVCYDKIKNDEALINILNMVLNVAIIYIYNVFCINAFQI